jgi:ferredoxin
MITRGRTDVVLRVDPIACRAHGLCAEELPEAITLDEWGYPIMPHRTATAGAAAPRQVRGGRVPRAGPTAGTTTSLTAV